MTPREDVTLLPCGRCDSLGARREVTETATSYRVTSEESCWCCESTGLVTIETARAWILAGRPLTKPDGWAS